MKIRNAIPPLALSALLITNVSAQDITRSTDQNAEVKNVTPVVQNEDVVAGSVSKPKSIKSGVNTSETCFRGTCMGNNQNKATK